MVRTGPGRDETQAADLEPNDDISAGNHLHAAAGPLRWHSVTSMPGPVSATAPGSPDRLTPIRGQAAATTRLR